MKLLLVDDDHIIIKGIQNILQKLQLEKLIIYTARNAADALEILKYNSIDLLITDIDMPITNGLELIAETQKRGACKRYIIISGHDKFEFARKAIHYQVIEYLLKPLDKAVFTALVRKIYEETHIVTEAVSGIRQLSIYQINANEKELPETLRKITEYLQDNYLKAISLEELGRLFSLHPNYICNLFQTYLHTTVMRYLECLRLQKSVSLLLEKQDMPVERVSELCGFYSERQFYKVFKKLLDMTPGGFRKKYAALAV